MAYTYTPSDITENTVSRVRFELGDIAVSGGAETCFLADEEISAIIGATTNWKKALYELANAVCMRLSYETNWRDDGTSFDLGQRAARWAEIRDRLKKEMSGTHLPTSGAVSDSIRNTQDGGHYFYGGMMQSPDVQPPMPYGGEANG